MRIWCAAIWCAASDTVLSGFKGLWACGCRSTSSRIGIDPRRKISIPDDSDALTARYDGKGEGEAEAPEPSRRRRSPATVWVTSSTLRSGDPRLRIGSRPFEDAGMVFAFVLLVSGFRSIRRQPRAPNLPI